MVGYKDDIKHRLVQFQQSQSEMVPTDLESNRGVRNMIMDANKVQSDILSVFTHQISKKCDETTPLLSTQSPNGIHSAYVNGDSCATYSVSSNGSTADEKELFPPSCNVRKYLKVVKITVLCGIMLFAVVTLMFIEEKAIEWKSFAVKLDDPVHINLSQKLNTRYPILQISAYGPFLPQKYTNFSSNHVHFKLVQLADGGLNDTLQPVWILPIPPALYAEQVDSVIVEKFFNFMLEKEDNGHAYQLIISTDDGDDYVSIGISLSYNPPIATDSIIMAAIVLIGLYVLIIFDLVHRTLAAIIGATVAIGFLSLVGERPTLATVMSWLDVETLALLFGMMVMVAIFCETGFFDYVAVLAFRLARGRPWPLMIALSIFTAMTSAFLDNVTTILLITAVTIRLCEVLSVDPKHFLIVMVLFSNIGGAATPVGDPPNVIIINNPIVKEQGIDFASFTAHAFPNILLCILCTCLLLRLTYRNKASMQFEESPEAAELKHEIDVWRKACNSISGYTKDEITVRTILKKKVQTLKTLLRKKLFDCRPSEEDYMASLAELRGKYTIRNKRLLAKCSVVMLSVIALFFLQSWPKLNLSLGWIAILGAIMLLILADFEEIESIMGRVEWSTLIFFAALFVVMEALAELRLIWFIGEMTQEWISAVDEDQRLLVAILLVLWVSALASSFIDNIPFTTAMVHIVTDLADNDELDLPLTPLVYALAFGTCLGGNGTLIGASANVVCAGLSEQHGYRFSFMDFFKVGFPVMLLTTVISSAYLVVCHVVLEWND